MTLVCVHCNQDVENLEKHILECKAHLEWLKVNIPIMRKKFREAEGRGELITLKTQADVEDFITNLKKGGD